MASNKKTCKKQRLQGTKSPELAGIARNTPDTWAGESNFDELTPEQQEQVRKRMARFFLSILRDSGDQIETQEDAQEGPNI